VNAKYPLKALLVAGGLVILTAGCSQATGSPVDSSKLQGTITISGAFALYPMMVRWGEEFQKLHPDVKLDVSAGGAGKGIADVLGGAVDIGMVSREITPQEEQKGAFWVPVTRDAVFVTVNERNPVWEDLHRRGVTHDTFVGIYVTGDVKTWGQVVGRPEIVDLIHVFTRSDACGAADAWSKYLGKTQEDLLGVGVYGDPGVVEAVVKDPLGIGYNNGGYAYDLATDKPVAGSRVVPIDANGNGQADPSEVCDTHTQAVDAVVKGLYPSPPARDLYLVTKGKPAGLTRALIEWVLGDGQKYVPEAGFVSLPQDKLNDGVSKLK